MRLLALGFVALVLLLPSAGTTGTSAKPLKQRVAKLEARVSKLETEVATISRLLTCLQIPKC
jgi:hypothetical protein